MASPDSEQIEILHFDNNECCQLLLGQQNQNLKALEEALGIRADSRGNEVTLRGRPEGVRHAINLLNQLYELAERKVPLGPPDILRSAAFLGAEPESKLSNVYLDKVLLTANGRRCISPKTPTQKEYVEAMRRKDLILAIGPAGTGKTYLAMAVAVGSLLRKDYKRIILTRPAVEAGERLGFLPGDIVEKVNPYLRPLYDALYDMVDAEKAHQWMQQGVVEVAPLAFMRGRTLNDSFIILDEGQNTTPEQMKMFLTRMGYGSKAVVTGDVTQIDLPRGSQSGLLHAADVLEGVDGIAVCRFTRADVVRHPLVQRIVEAYENHSQET